MHARLADFDTTPELEWPTSIREKRRANGSDLIVGFGKLVLDSVDIGNEALALQAGGAPANVTSIVTLAGGRSAIAGWCGADEPTSNVLAELTGRGIVDRFYRNGVTPQPRVHIDAGGQQTYTQDAGVGTIAPHEVTAKMLAGAGLVHFDGYNFEAHRFPEANVRAAEIAHDMNAVVSADMASADIIAADPVGHRSWLMAIRADIAMLSEAEAMALDVFDNPLDPVAVVVVHRDARPTFVCIEGAWFEVPVLDPVAKPLSALGCGDAAAGGLLLGLAKGLDVRASILLGHDFGRQVLDVPGAQLPVRRPNGMPNTILRSLTAARTGVTR